MSDEPQSADEGATGATMSEAHEAVLDALIPEAEREAFDANVQALADAQAVIPSRAAGIAPDDQGEDEALGDEEAPAKAQFGKLSAQEAGRKGAALRWERERQRRGDEAAQAVHERQDEALVVRTTIAAGKIIKRLESDAIAGSAQSARELREWLDRVDVEQDTSISALDRRTIQEMKARLLDEIAADRAAAEHLAPMQDDEADGEGGHPGEGRDS